MKKLAFLIAICVLPLLVFGQTFTKIKPSGSVTVQERTVGYFNKVSVQSGIKLTVVNGNEAGIAIKTHENIQPYVEVFVKDNTLVIRVKSMTRLDDNTVITASLIASDLEEISASGGSSATMVNTFKSKDLELGLSGGAKAIGNLDCDELSFNVSGGARFEGNAVAKTEISINLSGGARITGTITCKSMDIDISGGAKAVLKGSCDNMDMDVSGGARFENYEFSCKHLSADLSGGASATVSVSGHNHVEISGGAWLKIKDAKGNIVSYPLPKK